MLAGKGVKAKTPERGVIRAGEGTVRVGQDFYAIPSIKSF